jgi:hypothetical protein
MVVFICHSSFYVGSGIKQILGAEFGMKNVRIRIRDNPGSAAQIFIVNRSSERVF